MTQSKMHWGQKSSGKKKREIEKSALHCEEIDTEKPFSFFALRSWSGKNQDNARTEGKKEEGKEHYSFPKNPTIRRSGQMTYNTVC